MCSFKTQSNKQFSTKYRWKPNPFYLDSSIYVLAMYVGIARRPCTQSKVF